MLHGAGLVTIFCKYGSQVQLRAAHLGIETDHLKILSKRLPHVSPSFENVAPNVMRFGWAGPDLKRCLGLLLGFFVPVQRVQQPRILQASRHVTRLEANRLSKLPSRLWQIPFESEQCRQVGMRFTEIRLNSNRL